MFIDVSGFPILESILLWGIALIFFMMFGFGIYAYRRQKSGNPIKGVTINEEDVWIGTRGQGLYLRIQQVGDAIRVRWALMNYVLVIVATFVFGPGMTLAFIMFPEKVNKDVPLPVWLLVGGIMFICYYAFAKQLKTLWFEEPAFDVTTQGIVLLKGGDEVGRLRATEIKNLSIEKSTFQTSGSKGSPGRWVDNFTLIANMEDGKLRRLCITDNKKQTEALKRDLESKLRLTPEEETNPSAGALPPA